MMQKIQPMNRHQIITSPDIDLTQRADSGKADKSEMIEILAELATRGTVTTIQWLISHGLTKHAQIGNAVRARAKIPTVKLLDSNSDLTKSIECSKTNAELNQLALAISQP